jgi:hypothetical protein
MILQINSAQGRVRADIHDGQEHKRSIDSAILMVKAAKDRS